MSTEVLSQNLTAGQKAMFGAGTQFVIVSATTAVTIIARTLGSSNKNRTFTGVPAGFKFTSDTPDDGFDLLEVTSPVNQAFSISVGNDDVEFSNAVTVTGGVTTQEAPKTSVADQAPVVTIAGQHALFAGNGGRRAITISADPANPNTVYFRTAAGGNDLAFVQPGQSVEFDGTYAIDYRDPTGGNTLYRFEES
jgi:hypothetical protein